MFVETRDRPSAEVVDRRLLAASARPMPSLGGFALWLGERNPAESYFWLSCRHCAVAQYARSIGYPDNHLSGWTHMVLTDTPEGMALTRLNQLARGRGGHRGHEDWTFGACLERVLVAMASDALAT